MERQELDSVTRHQLGSQVVTAKRKKMETNLRNAVLGSGGYGPVFKGEWNSKEVAVKRIRIENVQNSKEDEALKKLDHPNVVKLHDESDKYRYPLELCQLSLHQLFHGNDAQKNYREKMPPDEEVCLQLAKGLAHIHESGLIHRDIKPDNVLITVDSTPIVVLKWADFRLRKQSNPGGSHSISGVRGTDNWYSPEILKTMTEENDGKTTITSPNIRQRGTVKSDVFSAGLVFGYYLLDGHHPFGSPIEVLQNIVKNEPVNLTKINKHSMHAIIMDMLKDNPDERISSAEVVSRINKNEYKEDSITVWHGSHCPNCVALKSIDEVNFARLQHHLKYCSIYCVFYQLMTDLEKRVMSNENMKDKYKKESHIFQSKQAQHLCELSAENPHEFSSTKTKLFFEMAAKLSEELLGPAETATFNCNRYEEYMRLLLEIAWTIKADIELIGDIETYLKPFDRNRIATCSNPYNKWDETFFDLQHSPEDENFGSDLKEIAEPESSKNSFLIPTEYEAKCHKII